MVDRMDQENAIEAFTALAQETRLQVFQHLVREGKSGLPVGEISRRLDIVPSTLSGHLGVLKRAGLLTSTRHQREIHYAADITRVSALIQFLVQDCCGGRSEDCAELLTFLKD